jgi:DNA-directed RNA polymerase specialized sigma24 family protein
MAVAGKAQEKRQIGQETALAGILALLVDERERSVEDDKDAIKTEVLLDRAGLPVGDIAVLVGKNDGAVRKTISRAKAK